MGVIYDLLIGLSWIILRTISPFNSKIKDFVKGRRFPAPSKLTSPIWFHCASVGEFEQARPVIEFMKREKPNQEILVSFFSPSGYNQFENKNIADHITYSPFDRKKDVTAFLRTHNPSALFLIKYEFWHNLIKISHNHEIPIFSVSSIFRKDQRFFGTLKSIFKPRLLEINHFFVQNTQSQELLGSIDITNVTVTGDTRFDRVIEIAENSMDIDQIEQFSREKKVIVAGSTWAADEHFLKILLDNLSSDWHLIIAPHEVNSERISSVETTFSNIGSFRFSGASEADYLSNRVLILDSIGLLSRAYKYGQISYIGGAFGSGLHNILEAAVWGKAIIHGPKFQKFNEAKELAKLGGSKVIESNDAVPENILDTFSSGEKINSMGNVCKSYVYENMGATVKVTSYLKQNDIF